MRWKVSKLWKRLEWWNCSQKPWFSSRHSRAKNILQYSITNKILVASGMRLPTSRSWYSICTVLAISAQCHIDNRPSWTPNENAQRFFVEHQNFNILRHSQINFWLEILNKRILFGVPVVVVCFGEKMVLLAITRRVCWLCQTSVLLRSRRFAVNKKDVPEWCKVRVVQ